MPTSNKIKTLVFPVLNLLAALILSSNTNPTVIGEAVSTLDMTFLLGALASGIVPLVLIIVLRLDTSEYFIGQLFFIGASVISCMASFTYYEGYFPVVVPIILLIICLAFRLYFFVIDGKTSLKDIITLIVVTVSNPLLLYLGLLLDFIRAWNNSTGFDIGG